MFSPRRIQYSRPVVSPRSAADYTPLSSSPLGRTSAILHLPLNQVSGILIPSQKRPRDDDHDRPVTALKKLRQLLNTITGVLKAYDALPMLSRSPKHLQSLRGFQERCVWQLPDDEQYNWRAENHRRPSVIVVGEDGFTSTLRPTKRRSAEGVDEVEVDRIEKDWWASEVVAAWFGPGQARKGTGQGREGLKRDMSYVGLFDE